MLRRKTSPMPQPEEGQPTASDTAGAESAKLADAGRLPPLAEDGVPPLSLARPKIGRVPEKIERISDLASHEMRRDALLSEEPRPAGFFGRRMRAEHQEPPLLPEPPRVWDSRFALFFVMLLIGVNLGLVALVHNGHKAAISVTSAPAGLYHEAPVSFAITPPEAASHTVDAAPQKAISAPVYPQAAIPPAAIAMPALKELPALSPSAQAPQAPVSSPAAAPAAGRPQDLLSIINKE